MREELRKILKEVPIIFLSSPGVHHIVQDFGLIRFLSSKPWDRIIGEPGQGVADGWKLDHFTGMAWPQRGTVSEVGIITR